MRLSPSPVPSLVPSSNSRVGLNNLVRFIVTAYRWGEYLGRIDVAFEAEGGRILAYTGAPIIMTQNMTQDEELQSFIEEARVPFEAVRSPFSPAPFYHPPSAFYPFT